MKLGTHTVSKADRTDITYSFHTTYLPVFAVFQVIHEFTIYKWYAYKT